jgi:ankyrin repeat domain-containing protein 50
LVPGTGGLEDDPWANALSKLNDEDQATIQQLSGQSGVLLGAATNERINGLIALVSARRDDVERRFWRVRIGDKDVVIRDWLASVVEGLNKVKEIGKIVVQQDPTGQAALPWVILGSLLQTATIESEEVALLLESLDRVTRVVNRSRIYELLFRPGVMGHHMDSLRVLHRSLIAQYASVLELTAHVYRQLSRKTVARGASALWNPQRTQELLDAVSKQEQQVKIDADICQISRTLDTDAKTWNAVRELHGLLMGISGPTISVSLEVRAMLHRIQQKELLEVLEWLSCVPYNKHHDEIRRSRVANTCDWLVSDVRFKTWEESENSMMLWLRGYGKSHRWTNLLRR